MCYASKGRSDICFRGETTLLSEILVHLRYKNYFFVKFFCSDQERL